MRHPVRLLPLLLVLAALPRPAAAAPSPYARANSKALPVYSVGTCQTACYSATDLLNNPPQQFRMSATSRDGRYTAFYALDHPYEQYVPVARPAVNVAQVFVYDRKTGVVELASRGLDGKPPAEGVDTSKGLGITADGRYTWFTSAAPNLVKNDRNAKMDFFAYDRVAKRVARLSLDVKGNEIGGALLGLMSADGSTIAFVSNGDVLRKGVTQYLLYFKNLRTKKAGVVVDSDGKPNAAFANNPGYLLTPNGRYLLDTEDVAHTTLIGFTNTYGLYDLWTGKYVTVPGGDRGLHARASIDAAARSVVFDSRDGLIRVDLTTGVAQTAADLAPTLVRPQSPTLSDDGRTLVVAAAGAVGADPTQASGGVYAIALDAAGKPGTPRLLTPLPAPGSCVAADCARHQFAMPVVSGNGRAATFLTDQALVAEDPAAAWDVYVVAF
jgi:hypothetical protein